MASPSHSSSNMGSLVKYNSKQMDRALRHMKERKKARQKARDEEKCYVEYRKQQVLSSFQPTVAALRSGDEVFPKRRRGSMGFGERKAHYLAIRPNARFAYWLGKKKGGAIEAKPQIVAATVQFTDHSATPDVRRAEVKVKDTKGSETAKSAAMADDAAAEEALGTQSHDEHNKGDKRGNKADNPLVNGAPFWTVLTGNETEEITDEDLPVDMDILERVCNGDLSLSQKNFVKTKFNPFGSVTRFKFDDVLFARDTTLFTSTVEAVICLQPDEDVVYPVHPPIQRLVRWADKIQVAYYDPNDREVVGSLAPEEMKDIKRENLAKK